MYKLVCVLMLSAAQSFAVTMPAEAVQAYHEQRYQDAEQGFLAHAPQHPAVWYNAGNAAYQQRNYPRALVYWLRATNTNNAQLYQDAYKQIQNIQNCLGHEPTQAWRLHYYIGLLFCYVPLWLVQLLCIAMLVLIGYRVRYKILYRWYVWCISVLSVVVITVSFCGNPYAKSVVILGEHVGLYAGPHTGMYQLATIEPGAIVRALKRAHDWTQVQYQGRIGWVADEYIAFVIMQQQ